MRGGACTIVTRMPKRSKICANSRPTGPPPSTSIDSGSSSSSSAVTWSIQSSGRPGIGGTAVREPVAIRMRSPTSSCPSTRTVRGSTKVALPGYVSKPFERSSSTHFSCGLRRPSIHARTRARSARSGAARPNFVPITRRSRWSSAATRYAFVGLQATFGQDPPQRVLSISATFAPYSFAAFCAASRAAEPAPITIRS
jgi:hypothetical protein